MIWGFTISCDWRQRPENHSLLCRFIQRPVLFWGLGNDRNRFSPIPSPKEFLEAGVLFYELAANVLCSVAWDIRRCAAGQRTIDFGSANQRLVLVDLVCALGFAAAIGLVFPAQLRFYFSKAEFLPLLFLLLCC